MSVARVIPLLLATYTAAAISFTAGHAEAVQEALAGQPPAASDLVGHDDRSIGPDQYLSPLAAPSFSRIVIAREGGSTFEGRGTPGSQVIIHSDGRMIGAALVAESGRWEVRLDQAFDEGDYRVSTAASRRTEVIYGDDVRIAVPKDFAGPAVIAYETPPASQLTDATSAGEAVRHKAEELAAAASRRFSEVLGGGRERIQVAEAREKAAQDAAPSSSEGLVPRVADWLEHAAKEYQSQIIDKLSVPSGSAASPPSPARSEARDVKPSADEPLSLVSSLPEVLRSALDWVQHWFERADGSRTTAETAPAASGGKADRATILGDDRLRAKEEARRRVETQREAEEAVRKFAEARRLAEMEGSKAQAKAGEKGPSAAENKRVADAAALEQSQEQRKAEAKKQLEENEKRIVEGLKKLDEARKAEDERKAAEGEKRQSDAAAERRKEEEALKQRQEQQKADAVKRRQENEKRIMEGLKKLDEARVAEEERKAAEAKRIEVERAIGLAKTEDARKAAEAKRIAEEASRKAAEAKRLEDERAAAEKATLPSGQGTPEEKPRELEMAMRADATGGLPREARSSADDGAAAAAEVKEPTPRVATVASEARRAAPRRDAARSKGWRHRSSRREAGARFCRGKAAHGGRKLIRYRVRRGDTLWSIASRYLRSGERYEFIYRANRRQIRNPDLISPGQCLVVPRKKGRLRG